MQFKGQCYLVVIDFQLYGMMTNDKHRPSFANIQGPEAEADRINRDVLKSGKSRDVILCSECFTPRCVYSNTKMSREEVYYNLFCNILSDKK